MKKITPIYITKTTSFYTYIQLIHFNYILLQHFFKKNCQQGRNKENALKCSVCPSKTKTAKYK